MTTELGVHPAAELFPLMADDDLAALAANIEANDLHETIKLLAGAILDGRNRLRACAMANVDPASRSCRPIPTRSPT